MVSMMDLSPFTGFGNDTNSAVEFSLLHNRDGRIPRWSGGPRLKEYAVRHSDRTITQNGGRDPWVITLRCGFATSDDLEMMEQVTGLRATLRYKAGLTNKAGGTVQTLGSVPYLILPDTLLLGVSDGTCDTGGVNCEAMLTFSRAGVSSAWYGISLYSE